MKVDKTTIGVTNEQITAGQQSNKIQYVLSTYMWLCMSWISREVGRGWGVTVSMKQHLPAVFVATRVDISDETSRQFEAKKKKKYFKQTSAQFQSVYVYQYGSNRCHITCIWRKTRYLKQGVGSPKTRSFPNHNQVFCVLASPEQYLQHHCPAINDNKHTLLYNIALL